jgi:UPF0755 protein
MQIIQKNIVKIFIAICIVSFTWIVLTSSPLTFKQNSIVRIEKGDSVKSIARQLKEKDMIHSEIFFTNTIIFLNLESKLVAGEYMFKKSSNMFEIIRRISAGDYGIDVKRVTFVEGITVKEIGILLEKEFYNITEEDFIAKALPYEGYLFPDTYFFTESITSEEIITKMRTTFDQKIASDPEILNSEKSLKDIVIMASIIEKEASATSMQEVSDILWHRIDIGMPLQVDAGFVYERNKHTFELSLDDLRRDSPYNTYTRLGFTPTPISNPGLQALRAAAFPNDTDYLYFLTGYDGEMYYAKTLKEHDENKEKYLRE